MMRYSVAIRTFQTNRNILSTYDYPGNIRELQNLIERGVINAADSEPLDVLHIFDGVGFIDKPGFYINSEGDLESGESQKAVKPQTRNDTKTLSNILYKTGGNVSKAARELGITRVKLAYRIQKAGLDPNTYRHL